MLLSICIDNSIQTPKKKLGIFEWCRKKKKINSLKLEVWWRDMALFGVMVRLNWWRRAEHWRTLSCTWDLRLSLWAKRVGCGVEGGPRALRWHGDPHGGLAEALQLTQALWEKSGLRRVLQLLPVSYQSKQSKALLCLSQTLPESEVGTPESTTRLYVYQIHVA